MKMKSTAFTLELHSFRRGVEKGDTVANDEGDFAIGVANRNDIFITKVAVSSNDHTFFAEPNNVIDVISIHTKFVHVFNFDPLTTNTFRSTSYNHECTTIIALCK